MTTGGIEPGGGDAFTEGNDTVESNALLSSGSILISDLVLPNGNLLENGLFIFVFLLLHSSRSGNYKIEANMVMCSISPWSLLHPKHRSQSPN